MAKAARASLFLKCGLALDQWPTRLLTVRETTTYGDRLLFGNKRPRKPTGKVTPQKATFIRSATLITGSIRRTAS